MSETKNPESAPRQRWMSVLAKAKPADVFSLWDHLNLEPVFEYLRPPETGLVMTRGRMGGVGDAFNLGEMTVTRCSVRLEGGPIGHASVAGRSKEHASAAAVIDGLMQGSAKGLLEERVIHPLEAMQRTRRQDSARKAAATKVDFFTMARSTKPK